jgi:hypothetical protein
MLALARLEAKHSAPSGKGILFLAVDETKTRFLHAFSSRNRAAT